MAKQSSESRGTSDAEVVQARNQSRVLAEPSETDGLVVFEYEPVIIEDEPAIIEAEFDAEESESYAELDDDPTLLVVYARSRPKWHAQAMCSGKTEIFFAGHGERDGRRRKRESLARAYCAVCAVQDECREAGRAGREHGLWGSENDEERALAGFGTRSPHRRAVATAMRWARTSPEE